MFSFKQNFMCEVGREQNFRLNNKYDQLLSFLRYNYNKYNVLTQKANDKSLDLTLKLDF